MKTFLIIMIAVLMLSVVGVLFAGIFGMGRPGEGAGRRANILMRYRVVFQFGALAMVLILGLALRSLPPG